MGFHLAHQWRTERDDGCWYYQFCAKCKERRVKAKEGKLAVTQKPNPVWLQGGALPTPIGED